MKYCEQCGVTVNNPMATCPLCCATMTVSDDTPESLTYPDYQGYARRYNLVFRILLMLSLSSASVCVTINLLTGSGFLWSMIVVTGIIYMWISLTTALHRHMTLGLKILVQVSSLAGLVVAVDFFVGRHAAWAYDYVLPGLFAAATLLITILIIVKRVKLGEFILYFMLIALLGFIPLILLGAGLVQEAWPAIAAAVYAGLSLISLFVFADNATKIEMKKRLHI